MSYAHGPYPAEGSIWLLLHGVITITNAGDAQSLVSGSADRVAGALNTPSSQQIPSAIAMTYRSFGSSLLLVVSCLALLGAASARSLSTGDTRASEYTSNTQQCIVSSPKLQACAQLPFGSNSATWWNVGGHFLECCSALREFNGPGCFW